MSVEIQTHYSEFRMMISIRTAHLIPGDLLGLGESPFFERPLPVLWGCSENELDEDIERACEGCY